MGGGNVRYDRAYRNKNLWGSRPVGTKHRRLVASFVITTSRPDKQENTQTRTNSKFRTKDPISRSLCPPWRNQSCIRTLSRLPRRQNRARPPLHRGNVAGHRRQENRRYKHPERRTNQSATGRTCTNLFMFQKGSSGICWFRNGYKKQRTEMAITM